MVDLAAGGRGRGCFGVVQHLVRGDDRKAPGRSEEGCFEAPDAETASFLTSSVGCGKYINEKQQEYGLL